MAKGKGRSRMQTPEPGFFEALAQLSAPQGRPHLRTKRSRRPHGGCADGYFALDAMGKAGAQLCGNVQIAGELLGRKINFNLLLFNTRVGSLQTGSR
jgi:hypothetical protein